MKNGPRYCVVAGLIGSIALAGCASSSTGDSPNGSSPSTEPGATSATGRSGGNTGSTAAAANTAQLGPLSAVEASQLRERAIAILEQAAFDPWALLRANAIEGLQSAPARAEPIVRAGLVDENPGVRYVAAMTVGQLKMESLRIAVTNLANDPDPCAMAASIYARVRLGESPDRTPLGTLLLHGDVRSRANAAFILGELRDASAAPMLRDAAKRLATPGGDPSIGPAASRLLRLHVASALVKLGDAQMVQALRAALYPSVVEEMEDAVLAAQMLGELKDEGSIAQLVEIIEYRVSGRQDRRKVQGDAFLYPIELRLAAATSLAKMGYRDGAYVGLTSEVDPMPAIRAQTAFLYGAIGDPVAARKLAGMLDDPDAQVRVAGAANLIRTLGRRGLVSAGR